MYKTFMVLPDGTQLSSGAGEANAIKSVTITESVNDSQELAVGSTCANMLEAKLITPKGGLSITTGDEISVYKVNEAGERFSVGIFIAEKPTRPTSNSMSITAYDRIVKLDKDLTSWLKGLAGWPYRLIDFAGMVCEACGLELVTNFIPNGDFLVRQMSIETTGRQLMRWIGQICCRFCRATPNGKIELGWYTPAGVSITPSGDSYYLQNSLSYEEYEVAPVDAVQMRLANDQSGAVWPEVHADSNSYIIEWNPILLARVTDDLLPVLDTIKAQMPVEGYRPCKVSIPQTPDIHAGNTVQITDKNGVTFTTYVMTKTQAGQKDTLECVGSPRRPNTTSGSGKTEQEKTLESKNYADNAAEAAKNDLDKQLDQANIFDRLTNGGTCQGLFMLDGQLYINASYIKTGSIISEGRAYLPPTHEDVENMLLSLLNPGQYPPKAFYDLNGDGNYTITDFLMSKSAHLGVSDIADCPGAVETDVVVTINPWDSNKTINLTGRNMWGSEVSVSIGMKEARLPIIRGDCSVGGKFSVGEYAILQSLATDMEQEPKKLSWKKINGVNALIGYENEEPDVQSVATLYSGTLTSGSVSLTGEYSQYAVVGYTTSNQCKVSLTIPAAACDGSLFQLYADGEWVSFNMSEDALTISRVSNGGAITGIYGII